MADVEKTVLEQAVDRLLEHGFENHAVPGLRNGTNEFTNLDFGPDLKVETPDDMRRLIMDTLNDPETKGFAFNKDGSHLHFYNERNNVFISIEPNAGGTVFRPGDGAAYFDKQLSRAPSRVGGADNLVQVERGGYKALHESFTEAMGHIPRIRPLPVLSQVFNALEEVAPRLLGRTIKFLPLAGTAVTFFQGRAEAADLREMAQDAVANGKLPPEALDDYESVLTAHQLQVNLDISVVGHESKVQELFDRFADQYKLDDAAREALEPPSLFEDVTGIELKSGDPDIKPQAAPLSAAAP